MSSKKIVISTTLISLIAILAFQNCSDVEFDSTQPKVSSFCGSDCDPIDVINSCAEAQAKGAIQVYNQQVQFAQTPLPAGQPRCSWKQGPSVLDDTPDANGNLTMFNEYTRTRVEEYVNLNIPADAVLCSVDVRGDQQSFIHDDVFYFTYNNYVLASSLKRSLKSDPEKLFSNINFFNYDWASFRNTPFGNVPGGPVPIANRPDNYCLGADEGFGSCTIPVTDTLGTFAINFAPEVFVPISLKPVNGFHRLGVIVTGDDNPLDNNNRPKDCTHSDLDIEVRVEYFVSQ